MINVIINPGSGPVDNHNEENAIENIKHYITDCKVDGLKFIRIPREDYNKEYQDGRYAFLVWKGNRCHEIQMPGTPLNKVRYMGEEDQNVWDFPRLYVDGSSWLWCYAILDDDDE